MIKIFALQAESYLKLRKYQEADKSLANSPNFSVDPCTKFFGPIANASMLVIRAQVDMAVGRFVFCFLVLNFYINWAIKVTNKAQHVHTILIKRGRWQIKIEQFGSDTMLNL